MWEGRFSSLRLPQGVACGNISVDYIDINSDGYESNSIVVYTGVFRKGRKVPVKIIAKGNTMHVNLEGREVTFTIGTKTEKIIHGTYTVGKVDYGQFYLQPKGSKPIKNEQGCCIS